MRAREGRDESPKSSVPVVCVRTVPKSSIGREKVGGGKMERGRKNKMRESSRGNKFKGERKTMEGSLD